MPYVIRNTEGAIISISPDLLVVEGTAEFLPEDHPEVVALHVTNTPVITAAQAKVALYRQDLLTSVEEAVSQYPRDVQIWYDEAREWEYDNPYIQGIATELGITDDTLRDLFFYASELAA